MITPAVCLMGTYQTDSNTVWEEPQYRNDNENRYDDKLPDDEGKSVHKKIVPKDVFDIRSRGYGQLERVCIWLARRTHCKHLRECNKYHICRKARGKSPRPRYWLQKRTRL